MLQPYGETFLLATTPFDQSGKERFSFCEGEVAGIDDNIIHHIFEKVFGLFTHNS